MTNGETILIFLLAITGAVVVKKLNKIIMTNEELVVALDAQTEKVNKVITEIQALKDLVGQTDGVPQVVIDAVDRLNAAIDSADAMNEDATAPTE
jgi:hypothetical protein